MMRNLKEKLKIREVLQRLKNHPLVSKISFERVYGNGTFTVTFTDGITETWYMSGNIREKHIFDSIMPTGEWFKNKQIKTYKEFETNPLNPDYQQLQSYFLISKKELKEAGFCEVRLKIHELIDSLVKEGWIPFKYPENSLRKDFESLKKDNLNKYAEGTHRIAPYRNRTNNGKLLLMHFNDIGDIKYSYRPTFRESWAPIPLYQAINAMVISRKNITRSAINRSITIMGGRHTSGFRVPLIHSWQAILTKMKVTSVYDLEPNYGEKAIAAAAHNIQYKPLKPINSDLLKFIGSKEGKSDITILNCLTPLSDDELQSRIKSISTTKAIAIVTKEQWRKLRCLQQYEIRIDPSMLGNILHMVVLIQI